MSRLLHVSLMALLCVGVVNSAGPIVVNTWNFDEACAAAWDRLNETGATAIDAVEAGATYCETAQCDGSVGYGSHPDENGETTLDAMIMDGDDLNVGAVSALRRVKSAASVARHVLDHTHHSMLAGELAKDFAVMMGFKEESLSTTNSMQTYTDWINNNCQPNSWNNVVPDPTTTCGPYQPVYGAPTAKNPFGGPDNHDTIGLVAIDANGSMAAGTSTNGMNHKIPGRVGDSPIPGSGAYVDSEVGGAAATGDGDVMLRLLPAFTAVEAMRQGMSPGMAAQEAVDRVTRKYPDFSGAVIALNKEGEYGAGCHGMETFPFSVADAAGGVRIEEVPCAARKEIREKDEH